MTSYSDVLLLFRHFRNFSLKKLFNLLLSDFGCCLLDDFDINIHMSIYLHIQGAPSNCEKYIRKTKISNEKEHYIEKDTYHFTVRKIVLKMFFILEIQSNICMHEKTKYYIFKY